MKNDLNRKLWVLATSRAKSILGDGKWRHTYYDDAGMEDLIGRIIRSTLEKAYRSGYQKGYRRGYKNGNIRKA